MTATNTSQETTPTPHARALFAAGCFWGVEAAFRQVPGVVETADPSYKEVCTGATGHAETVEVRFDPAVVSYPQLLAVFWDNHDPTQLNRQGPDWGTQYRSAVFYLDAAQEAAARAAKDELQRSGRFSRPVVTEITAAGPFHRAEEYHQRYLEKRGLAHCALPPRAAR